MKFFVSYSRSVQASVREIVDALRDSHVDVWWDQDLRVGQDWWASIIDHIETCDIFIFIVSEKSVQSPYCMAELQYALSRNRLVLPYIVDDGSSYSLPAELTHIQYEYYKKNPDHFVNRLRVTCRDINWAQYQDRYAPRPTEPNTNSEDVVDQLDKAILLAGEGYFEEAIQIFSSVLHYAYETYGAFCNTWIERIHLYREIAKLASRPSMRHMALPKWEAFRQQDNEDFDPLSIELLFVADITPITESSHPSGPHHTKSGIKFDVYEAIMQFHSACDQQEWETAQRILQLIRASGAKLPVVFDLEANERELQRYFDEEERSKSYHLIRHMLTMKKPNYRLICDALETFWAKYPDYDPDGFRESKDLVAHAWLNVAQTRASDDYTAQINAYTEAIQVMPDFVEAYMERGACYYTIQDYAQAAADFTKAILISPQNSEAYYNRAYSYAAQNLRTQASNDFKMVLKLNPHHRHAEGIPKLLDMLAKNRPVRLGV